MTAPHSDPRIFWRCSPGRRLPAYARDLAAAPELYEVARSVEAMLTRQKWKPDSALPEGALLLNVRVLLARLIGGRHDN